MALAKKKTQRGIHMRWMTRRDLPHVLQIEEQSFKEPWNEDNFLQVLRLRNCIGMVIEYEDLVIGFVLYELHDHSTIPGRPIEILNIAVCPEFRRMMVGTSMIEKLKSKLSWQRRRKLMAWVSERNLEAQVWFRSNGFLCTKIEKGRYPDQPEIDAYKFEFVTDQEEETE
jgi:[ribosomal protein S18]-alanine N-acetyltransferase